MGNPFGCSFSPLLEVFGLFLLAFEGFESELDIGLFPDNEYFII